MPRNRSNLNRDWSFHRGDWPAGQWRPIGLPHTFDLPYFRTPEFFVGHGWYKKTLSISPDWIGKRLSLQFHGVFQSARISLHGRPVGAHRGGYTPFTIDISHAVTAGENPLEVEVDNCWDATLPPRAGEHIFCGGIYRDVYLIVTETIWIDRLTITTPLVCETHAVVNTKTRIENHTDAPERRLLSTQILTPDGVEIAREDCLQIVPPGGADVEQTFSHPNPRLWHPDHPHLYTVNSQLAQDDFPADQTISPFGFRWFQWTADRGFFLNGRRLYLRGANAHQDHSGWGIGITQAAVFRDVRLLKEAGFNFVRGAHYPHHPAFADACDRLGLICLPEACFWGKGGFGPDGYWNASAYPPRQEDRGEFENHCLQMLDELVASHRNHPSIVAWSLTNEAFFTFGLDRAKSLISKMVDHAHAADPTRPAAIGGAQRGEVDHLGDIAAYNGDGARLFINPGIPNLVSEYGAISKPIDAFEPFYGELQTEPFAWRSGQAIWCGFDYGSIAGRQGLKGILRHDRLPKRSWHWYRQELRQIAPPVWPGNNAPAALALSADKTTLTAADATDDCQIIVTVLDAAGQPTLQSPPVTLTISSGPGEFPTGRAITFDAATDISIAAGQAAVAFRSYHGGKTLIQASSPGLAGASMEIITHGQPRFVEGQTPPPPDRPYHPPRPSPAAIAAMKNIIDVARDRPSRASSEAAGHPARLANDADPASFWRPSPGDAAPWLTIDLEGFYELSGYKLVFAAAANHRYRIETALAAGAWRAAVDCSQTQRADATRNDVFDPGAVARYVRITFSLPAGALCHFELYGILSLR